ncbi:nucleotide exchange factor GrpE [Acidithiobacillus montserratensis]|uniref:Nucleotide exchange factor GrpE n=1 Tax=Acidithiobacillus montserratensis TaxID=2729135 RepID=A0ACD5HGU6_9PROT|nr:nucleotide exchange factor GrpE [Acidithiobacillus montserratensis]MBU2747164.1 nucleotide exchange factor GrpE [Acidithiobacillus montserratensis]
MSEEEKPVSSSEASEEAEVAENAETASDTVNWEEKAEAYRNDYLRALADAENQRKRSEKQIEDARNYAVDRFARELLPVIDSLELALATPLDGDEAITQFRQGIENTLTLFAQALGKAGIAPIEMDEGRFDPHLHQAIAMVEAEGDANRILAVHQKGYLMHDRLLRPAMVSVSKAPKAAS